MSLALTIVFIVAAILALAWLLTPFFMKVILPRLLTGIGQKDFWLNPIRIRPPDERFTIMAQNTPRGPFGGVIESVRESSYDADLDLFRPLTETEALVEKQDYLSRYGFAWVGTNMRYAEIVVVYVRYQQLEELDERGRPKFDLVVNTRGKSTDGRPPTWFRRHNFAVLVVGLEVQGNVKVDIILDVTVLIESVRRAFYFEGGWYTKVVNMIRAITKAYAGPKSYETLREEQEQGTETLTGRLYARNGETRDTPNSLRQVAGVLIQNANFVEVELTGSKQMAEALEAVKIEEQRTLAREIRGRGKRREREEEAEGIKKTVEAWSSDEAGGVAAIAEGLAKAGTQAVGGNFMTNLTQRIRGKKKEGEEKKKEGNE